MWLQSFNHASDGFHPACKPVAIKIEAHSERPSGGMQKHVAENTGRSDVRRCLYCQPMLHTTDCACGFGTFGWNACGGLVRSKSRMGIRWLDTALRYQLCVGIPLDGEEQQSACCFTSNTIVKQ